MASPSKLISVYLEIPQEGQRYFEGSFEQIWQRELMARIETTAVFNVQRLAREDWPSAVFHRFAM
jgi:hypothetical protein